MHDEPDRRLAAIFAADVVGFSRMIAADEAGTLARMGAARRAVIDPILAAHRGRIFKEMGDGLLVEFGSAVLALRAAIALQARLPEHNEAFPAGQRIELRIGVHQGDVVVHGTDLLGDGVNIAARLEPLAKPGGICLSARVREDAHGKIAIGMQDGGERTLKNVGRPMHVFFIHPPNIADNVEPPEERTAVAGAPQARSTFVVVRSTPAGPPAGEVVQFDGAPITVGRQVPSNVVLPGTEVSRAHCRIERTGWATMVVDLRSTNGTFVDDRRIVEPTPLAAGALLRIGPYVLRYDVDEEAAEGDPEATRVIQPNR